MSAVILERVDLVGTMLALRWSDGREDLLPAKFLREHSPSAENVGERDLTGTAILPASRGAVPEDVAIVGWNVVGGYALQIIFSDGHRTGLYSFAYLRRLCEAFEGG